MAGRLPPHIRQRLRLPLIAAPMFRVSGPALVSAACEAGIIGAFPTLNARSTDELEDWIRGFARDAASARHALAPWCANVVMRDPRAEEHLACLRRHPPEMAIASVGAPRPMIDALQDKGTFVLADVATLRHAQRAITDGVDGLVLLSAGAGGNSGWLSPCACVRTGRAGGDGPIVLAGGVSDGVALRAMEVLGCDLGYCGTRMIATAESLASEAYRAMLVSASMDDVVLTRAFTGLDTNMLRPSIEAAGIDLADIPASLTAEQAKRAYANDHGARRWTDLWSAGHAVSGVRRLGTVRELVDELSREYFGIAGG
jgi:nitronate monooxygenase